MQSVQHPTVVCQAILLRVHGKILSLTKHTVPVTTLRDARALASMAARRARYTPAVRKCQIGEKLAVPDR